MNNGTTSLFVVRHASEYADVPLNGMDFLLERTNGTQLPGPRRSLDASFFFFVLTMSFHTRVAAKVWVNSKRKRKQKLAHLIDHEPLTFG